MRKLVCAAVSLGAIALIAGPATAGDRPAKLRTAAAVSADSRAVPAAYRGPTVGHGYTADARRRADCLATYPSYDPRADRIRTDRGARRCTL